MTTSSDAGDHVARPSRTTKLHRQLTALAQAERGALQNQWLGTFGSRPPKRLSTALLVLALSYHIQAGRRGGLDADACAALGLPGEDWIAGGRRLHKPHHQAHAPSTRSRTARAQSSTEGSVQGAARTDVRNPGTRTQSTAQARPSPRPIRRSIKPGTRLLREWQGEVHEVVADGTGGFIYRGQIYRSLSAVARLITGTRWSGPTFFGIATKAQADRSAGLRDA